MPNFNAKSCNATYFSGFSYLLEKENDAAEDQQILLKTPKLVSVPLRCDYFVTHSLLFPRSRMNFPALLK